MSGNYRLTGDKNHNCYVSDMGAYSTSTIYKINSGQLVWSYTVPYWGGEGIFVNEFNKLFVIGEYGTGNTTLGQILCEYDDQGNNIWSYNIPNSADIGPGPIIEQNGSIYIGGQDKYKSFAYLMKIKSPDAPTAVHENSANSGQFNLYPNPSGSIFNLSYEGEANARTTLKVLDAAGKIVYTKNLNDFASGIQQQLDLSSLPKGIYFLHLLGEKLTETRKIIIE